MTTIKALGLALAAGPVLMGAPLAAAPFTFDVTVTQVTTVPDFALPALGTLGTLTFTLDAAALDSDGDPDTGVGQDNPLPQALADATVSFAGVPSLTVDLSVPSVFGFAGGARFSNGSFAGIVAEPSGADCNALGCTFAGNFSIQGPGSVVPATFADVEALLTNPASVASFSFNGTVQGEFVSFVAESVPIPLPAGGLLLLTGLGLLGLRRFAG